MDASLFIASRLSFKGRIAMVSIAISFLVMIVAVSVSSGFRREIMDGISSVSGDIQLTPPDLNVLSEGNFIESDAPYIREIENLACVERVVQAVYRAGIIKSGENIQGILLKGDPSMDGDSLTYISVPVRLTEVTRLGVGQDMTIYFVGDRVKVRKFRISNTYEPMLQTDGRMVAHVPMSVLQRLNGWDDNEVSAVEVMLKSPFRNEKGLAEAAQNIGFIASGWSSESDRPVVASSSMQRFPQLFDWLNLIGFNVVFILVLMTIVAGFNMISGLLIMLFENIPTIGLLKSLGMTDWSIAKVFLSCSAALVAKGMLVGNCIALLFCLLQGTTHFLKLDPANYFVPFVPVNVDWVLVLSADLCSFAVIMLLLLIPSLFIAKVDPARTVKAA